jgi:hypothetical protein
MFLHSVRAEQCGTADIKIGHDILQRVTLFVYFPVMFTVKHLEDRFVLV